MGKPVLNSSISASRSSNSEDGQAARGKAVCPLHRVFGHFAQASISTSAPISCHPWTTSVLTPTLPRCFPEIRFLAPFSATHLQHTVLYRNVVSPDHEMSGRASTEARVNTGHEELSLSEPKTLFQRTDGHWCETWHTFGFVRINLLTYCHLPYSQYPIRSGKTIAFLDGNEALSIKRVRRNESR